MVFSSLIFLFVFLPFVLAVYYILPHKYRNLFLLIADLFFYGWGEPVLVFLMVFTIVINYFAGLIIEKTGDAKKKIILIISVIIDLGLLAFFKYAGFITENLNIIIPFANIPVIDIPLPVGISFYIFQTMSYTIDVYREDTKAQHSLVAFGTYVSLFPQLIAGPIVRYKDVDEQLSARKENIDLFAKGIKLFTLGLAKKVLLANPMGLLWDSLRETEGRGAIASWVGVIAFSLQIYYDFSGYSDMARGLGNMFGFEFFKNFDYPYISKSITEFWRRWHISLGTWFREYVYIPLGGNRKGKIHTLINLLIVWFLTGLWHGASWNFIIWGLYFGIIIIIEKLFMLKSLDKLPSFISHIYSIFLILVGWIIFYYSDDVGGLSALTEYIPTLFTGGLISSDALNTVLSYSSLLIFGITASTPIIRKIYDYLQFKKGFKVAETIAVIVILIICTASLVNNTYNPFLYFKF
jgi:alginate O-acetyltransferase complex protein AlgI